MKDTFIATLQKAAEWRSRNLALHPNDSYSHTARAILLRLANQEPHPDLARTYEELAETYKVGTDRLIQAHHDVLGVVGPGWEPKHVDEVLMRIINRATGKVPTLADLLSNYRRTGDPTRRQ